MRFTPVAAAAIALGAVLGGFAATADAGASDTVQPRIVAFASSTDEETGGPGDNNGNG
ncbi:hypothetical protein [Streptomyces purpureus]|uniref:Uncharacterized protein n=1 Tax=Streptomyces purpureus TaxID=1951 RepID=A0A918LLR5_9ACTN|nr:hypothetical protein [Streptomyces purpureus]GGT19661.1 hypothetical protein GCM10014713_10870 [Streptomyces purpureus]